MGRTYDYVKRKGKKVLTRLGILPDEHKTRRYLGGMRPDKYYDTVVWKDLGETMQILGFKFDSGFDVFSAFIDIDEDNSGEIAVEEFHKWLGFPATKFSERVFGILDIDGSGQLDFKEFMIGVWNWNTYSAELVTKLAFNTLDVEQTGSISIAEADALLRMVYGSKKADPILLKQIDIDGDGDVSMAELQETVQADNSILAPAFQLQRLLRQRILGVRYWEQEMLRRKAYFSGYDSGNTTSWEAIRKILEIKHRERVEEELRKQRLKDMEAEARRQEEVQKELKFNEEMAARKAKRADEKKRKLETPEVRDAREAKEALEQCTAQRSEECVFADLSVKLDLRERYWAAYETWVRCQRLVEKAKCEIELQLSIGPDVQVKVEEDLLTEEGYADLMKEVLVLFTMEHTDTLYARDWPGDAWFASLMIRPPIDEFDDAYEPTWIAKQRLKYTTDKWWPHRRRRLRDEAKKLMVDDLREREQVRVEAENEATLKKFEDDCRERRNKEIGGYGKPRTRWERLWDADEGKPYWHQWETRESVWQKPVICHVCDANIPEDDTMCFKCKNRRSQFNQKIYDDSHKKIDYSKVTGGRDDDDTTKADGEVQEEDIVDVRELDDDDGPATLYQRFLAPYIRPLLKKISPTAHLQIVEKIREKVNDQLEQLYDKVPSSWKMDKRDKEIWRRGYRKWKRGWIKRLGLAAKPRRKVQPWHEEYGQEEPEEGEGRRTRPSLAGRRRSFEETGFKE